MEDDIKEGDIITVYVSPYDTPPDDEKFRVLEVRGDVVYAEGLTTGKEYELNITHVRKIPKSYALCIEYPNEMEAMLAATIISTATAQVPDTIDNKVCFEEEEEVRKAYDALRGFAKYANDAKRKIFKGMRKKNIKIRRNK